MAAEETIPLNSFPEVEARTMVTSGLYATSRASLATKEVEYEAPTHRPRRSRRDNGMIGHVLLLTSAAVVPALFGSLFLLSLGLHSHSGQLSGNGTYVRPTHEGLKWRDKTVSPLLISSLSSSTVDFLSRFVTLLLAYHLAYMWIRSQTRDAPGNLPTSYQYYLTMSLIDSPAPMSVLDSVRYIFRSTRSRRTNLARIFVLALSGAVAALVLASGIKVLDLVLHQQIHNTVLYTTKEEPTDLVAVGIPERCADPQKPLCIVANRPRVARLGGLNQSLTLRVYNSTSNNQPGGSVMFLGPKDPSVNVTIQDVHTYAASTVCKAYHPVCNVENMSIDTCFPNTDELDDSDIYQFVVNQGFVTTTMKYGMQTFLLSKGDVDVGNDSLALSNGANVNPLNFASWGCFDDYGDIQHDDGNIPPFQTPFINWWRYGQGIPNKPYKLCAITLCNTTIFDASYSASNGQVFLNTSSLSVSNKSTTLALSGAAVYLGTGSSDLYQYTSNYMDEMLQVDLSDAGNNFGNDTSAFANAWGAGLSARLLGWSAGAVELRPPALSGTSFRTNGAFVLSMNLWTAYAFAALHFLYAAFIVLLGASCIFIPASSPSLTQDEYSRDSPAPVSDVRASHAKLSDPSTLVLEVVDAWTKQRPLTLARTRTSLSLAEADAHNDTDAKHVQVGLKRRHNGALGLDLRDHQ